MLKLALGCREEDERCEREAEHVQMLSRLYGVSAWKSNSQRQSVHSPLAAQP